MFNKLDFKEISLRGRVSFAISCFENLLIKSRTDLDEWKVVLKKYWSFTNIEFLDDWYEIVTEILPDNLLEFKEYEEHDFEYLKEEEFKKLYSLYENIDKSQAQLMRLIFELGISHAYSVIVNEGSSNLSVVDDIINFMKTNNIPIPDVGEYKIFSIKENKGWGNKFRGESFSKILS